MKFDDRDLGKPRKNDRYEQDLVLKVSGNVGVKAAQLAEAMLAEGTACGFVRVGSGAICVTLAPVASSALESWADLVELAEREVLLGVGGDA